jgi:catechol 2,3-dioxygenase-like lactoylglutathione lyase family enzyme
MADQIAVLDQVNIITGDLQRSLDFYRLLGAVFPRPLPNSSGQLFHVSSEPNDGALLDLDSVEFAPVWNAGWAGRTDLQGRVLLGFRIATREGWMIASRVSRALATASFNRPLMLFGVRATRLSKTPTE